MEKNDFINSKIDTLLANIKYHNDYTTSNSDKLHKTIKEDLAVINRALTTNYSLVLSHYDFSNNLLKKEQSIISGADLHSQLFIQGLDEYILEEENLFLSNGLTVREDKTKVFDNINDYSHSSFISIDGLEFFISADRIRERNISDTKKLVLWIASRKHFYYTIENIVEVKRRK